MWPPNPRPFYKICRGKVHPWSFKGSKSIKQGQTNVFCEAGFCRRIATFGDCFSEFGEESSRKSIQKQIVDALYLDDRGRASTMLSELGRANNGLRADDFVDILRYCATSPDPLFAMETWKIMEEKEIGLDNISSLLMTRALCKGGHLDEAFSLINFIGEKHGMNPSLDVYNSFLEACSKVRSLIHANKCLDLMVQRMSGKNEVTYMQLLKLAVCQRNLSAVHEIWKDFTKLYSPSILSLQNLIQSFTRLGDVNSACGTLQYMVSLTLQGGYTSIRSTDGGRLYSSRLDIPIPSNVKSSLQGFCLKEKNEQFFPLMADVYANNIEQSTISISRNEVQCVGLNQTKGVPTMKVLKSSFGDVIHACAQTQNYRLAEQLMLQMQNLGVQPSSHTYDGFVRAVVSERALSMACSRNLELDLAEALLDQISYYHDSHPYNDFLKACDAMDKPERAVRMWATMKRLKIQPDIRTYELMFSLFGNVNAPYEDGNMLSQVDCAKRINAIEMDMRRNGIQHSHLSMKNLLKALGAEGMTRELIHYLRMAEDLFCGSNTYLGTPIYNAVLHSLVEAGESHLAIEMFKNMKSSGCRLNAATYTTMIDCCSTIQCYKSASALVSLMLRDGFDPETATYTALIKIPLEDGNFDEAVNLLHRGISKGIQPDVLLYNTILRKAWERERIDVIELIVEQMHRDKIKPDSATCSVVFSTYVQRGYHDTAMEALQILSMRMIGEDDEFQEKRAEYEDDFILSEDPETHLRILEYFGGPEENIVVALLNLRWCAIAGLPISWCPNESLWARRLSSNYDSTFRRIPR
ncbi:pentatricopeptide repeat-containing protein At1g76280 isoform X2 [Mercurialis annua]|uniref:pentatricopeptide repeat-containing protein At1g76280 isoform X2 n=1 Tax=Mercurialis annua TaxID=3986 RepID=UPI00215F3029|nr:pentatricopeptide repeat-containing protein At1g76280 isoform X2 [Mercurialis annua]